MEKIPVYQPYLHGNEKKYVNQCLDSNWISSKGEFISRFEQKFAEFVDISYATSVCNGTVAIHLALLSCGIQPGDEVIVPALTYVASVNTIVQAGAKPVFVDSLPDTWQMDPEDVRRKLTTKTRAIMAVHLYGHPCDLQSLITICQENKLYLIEDCAEAFGSYYQEKHVGTLGDIATFSFFGNKTLTTGEGGMLITNHPDCHARAANLKNQGISHRIQYWHDVLGYNYRMTNICAAIGLSQIENIDVVLTKKRQIAEWYANELQQLPLVTHQEVGDVRHSYWMCSILLNESKHRDTLRHYLDQANIETRPAFYPVHLFPMYSSSSESHPVAESLGARGINLPSWPGLKHEQVRMITRKIREYFVTTDTASKGYDTTKQTGVQ